MTNTKTGHTPLPWQSVEATDGAIAFIGNSDHGPIGWLRQSGTNSEEENATNIEFILSACNSYEALLEACRFTLLVMRTILVMRTNDDDIKQHERMAIAMLEAAIAQAEKKTP